MALVGGGGAGNVAGGGAIPAGTGASLNYIGNHAYGYSGGFEATTANQTMLSFVTGGSYIVGQLQFNGSIDTSNIGGGSLSACTVKVDSQVIAILKITGSSETAPYSLTQDLILPPYSKVDVIVVSSADAPGFDSTASITGRVY